MVEQPVYTLEIPMVFKIIRIFCIICILCISPAYAAEATIGISARILNITDMPPLEAFAECDRLALVCYGSCQQATPDELVAACTNYMLCCGLANPYMGLAFDDPLPATTGPLSSQMIDDMQVLQ